MRTAAAAAALGLTLLATAALAACTPDEPVEPPGPAPSRTPVFASEEEALAAAEALYREYIDAENELGARGWTETSLVEPYLRGPALENELATADELSSAGYRQVGLISFDSLTLQQLEDNGPRHVSLSTYLCLDVSGATIVDSDAEVVEVPNRSERLALEVEFNDVDGNLKIERSEAWDGSNFCS